MSREAVNRSLSSVVLLFALLGGRTAAQVKVGDASMNLNGTIAVGYNGEDSNLFGSSHSFAPSGIADLTGFYYNPDFLSFDIQPFYNQSNVTSGFSSITGAGGVTASASIFGGSNFPGSISYSKIYDYSQGNYGVPGLTNYTTNGDSDSVVVTWGVNLNDDLPKLHFGFMDGNNSYSIYGANSEGNFHQDGFNANASYRWDGFFMNGDYQYNGTRELTPQFLVGETPLQANTSQNLANFSVSHNLPFHGSASGSIGYADLNTNVDGDAFNTTIDTYSGIVGFNPIKNFNVGGNVYYTNNLQGTLVSTLVTAGVPPQNVTEQTSSNALGLSGSASYDMPSRDLHFLLNVSRQQQNYLGSTFISDSYYGGVTWFHYLFDGPLTATIGVTQTSVNTSSQGQVGVDGSVTYSHRIQRWTLSGSFSYNQAMQTLLAAYTSNSQTYQGMVGYKISPKSYWSATASGVKTNLNNVTNSNTSGQSYATSISISSFSASGSYAKSNGYALLTSAGLIPSPIPPAVINPDDIVLYKGDSYSAAVAAHPVRGLTFTALYSKAISNTQSGPTISNNNSENLNFFVTYHFRKLDLNGGYNKFNQGFSVTGGQPTVITSYFVGLKRWFNFF